MCTVSIICQGGELIRLACNRDEQLTRPVALPPQVAWFGENCAVMPIDPLGGGTWIAANDAGLAMTLLNLNPPNARAGAGAVSRGRIIPLLIRCASVDQATGMASFLDAKLYGPFQLVMVDRQRVSFISSDGIQIKSTQQSLPTQPILLTSSGLGDHLVQTPRRLLFEEMTRCNGVNGATQDAFHRHHWPERQHLSVCMRRPDAKTVSHAVIEIRPDEISFRYHPAAPDEGAADHRLTFHSHQFAST